MKKRFFIYTIDFLNKFVLYKIFQLTVRTISLKLLRTPVSKIRYDFFSTLIFEIHATFKLQRVNGKAKKKHSALPLVMLIQICVG